VFRGKDVEEINQLKRDGLSILAISNLTGYDRKTIRKYLLEPIARPVYEPRPAPVSKLAPFEAHLGERLQAGVWNAKVLLRELRSRHYTGGYTILTDWLRRSVRRRRRSPCGGSKPRRVNKRKWTGATWGPLPKKVKSTLCGASR